MTIKAIFFDMGGTIETFGFTKALRLRAIPKLRSLLSEICADLPGEDEDLLNLITRGHKRYHDLSIQTAEEFSSFQVWNDFILKGLKKDLKKLEKNSEELMFFWETEFYERSMRPEIPGVLDEIRGLGLKIGLISNVNSRGQVAFNLKKYGISHFFDPVVCSSEFGRRKPDPAIFHYAARLANTPASQCLYIGDRIARDILGAKRAGFRLAVQIQHEFEHGEEDDGAVPDRVIQDMRELVEIIREEQRRPDCEPGGRIRALVFDAGDILYYRSERGRYFREFLGSLGIEPEGPHIDEVRERLAYQAYRGLISQRQYQEQLLHSYSICEPGDIQRGISSLQMDEDNVVFFEGVAQTLLSLKQQGYLLGIITDTANSISTKIRWFEKGGFGHVWDSIISSVEFGTRKPDSVLYQAVLQQLNVTPDQVIFVGHKATELAGAQVVGMQTVAFNFEADAQADLSIEHFSDLLDVVTRNNLPIHELENG